MALLLLRAFSMGAGTYTGIEAVSNGLPILRESGVDAGWMIGAISPSLPDTGHWGTAPQVVLDLHEFTVAGRWVDKFGAVMRADALLQAGRTSHDTAWRMPLDEEYDEALKSQFADMANVGPRPGGAITAAMFLKRFTAKMRWAHLDIAGTAWTSGAAKGATGRPVALLTHFVLARAR